MNNLVLFVSDLCRMGFTESRKCPISYAQLKQISSSSTDHHLYTFHRQKSYLNLLKSLGFPYGMPNFTSNHKTQLNDRRRQWAPSGCVGFVSDEYLCVLLIKKLIANFRGGKCGTFKHRGPVLD